MYKNATIAAIFNDSEAKRKLARIARLVLSDTWTEAQLLPDMVVVQDRCTVVKVLGKGAYGRHSHAHACTRYSICNCHVRVYRLRRIVQITIKTTGNTH